MNTDAARDVLLTQGKDRMLAVPSSRRRRLILLALEHNDATTEAGVMVRGDHEKETVEAELAHDSLPKLEEARFIEWDPETGTIRKGPRFEEIEPLLALIDEHADELPLDWP